MTSICSYVLEATLRASLVQLAYALRQVLMIYFFIRVDSRFSLPPPNASLIGHGPMLSPTKSGLACLLSSSRYDHLDLSL